MFAIDTVLKALVVSWFVMIVSSCADSASIITKQEQILQNVKGGINVVWKSMEKQIFVTQGNHFLECQNFIRIFLNLHHVKRCNEKKYCRS